MAKSYAEEEASYQRRKTRYENLYKKALEKDKVEPHIKSNSQVFGRIKRADQYAMNGYFYIKKHPETNVVQDITMISTQLQRDITSLRTIKSAYTKKF